VLTTKYHEGFCLWDTKLTDYCAMQQGPGRDLVREFVEAARAEGLRVGFYYSLMTGIIQTVSSAQPMQVLASTSWPTRMA